LLRYIRENFDEDKIEIRVDANGAFDTSEALYKLNQLSGFKIHSIEQPIKKNQTDSMSELCKITPFPIALDEELIGVFSYEDKEKLLQKIRPQYIILKPSLIGGFRGSKQWIELAEKYNIGWWVTWRQVFQSWSITFHERFAVFVTKDCTFTTTTFSQQYACARNTRWVELPEFHIL